ncbi:MAG TPA: P-loop NTPase fold protein, partial [Pyrinomonadaceae bacterium]|nr:P-loop NTPase fold protein [Pyrinomonadaceae bacterium]
MSTQTPTELKNTFISDQPSPSDYLDFKPYVGGLVNLITLPETQTPLTLGISGSWGSGKTTLMHLMEKEVLARTKQQGRKLKCLWINVWEVSQHGEGGQALLQALFTQVRAKLSLRRRLSFSLYLLFDRIDYGVLLRQILTNSYRLLIVVAPLLFVWFVERQNRQAATVDEQKLSGGLSLLLGLWLVVKPILEAAREKVSLDLGAVLQNAPYEIKVSALQKLQQHFKRLVKEWVGSDGRLVVFIDDLDRCSPDRIAEILESLKLFATTEG